MANEQLRKQVFDALHFRHACKVFDDTKIIPEEDFDLILEAGRLSPSAFGFEPWSFVVLQNKEIREGLIPFSWGARRQAPTASHFVIILARKPFDTKYDSDYLKDQVGRILKLDEEGQKDRIALYENFQKSEFLLLDDERYLFDYACKQCYITMANMMLAAAFIGIDSCPMEGFDMKSANDYLVEKGIIDPKHFGVAVMVAFGYRADPEVFIKKRHDISEIVCWVE